MHPAYTQLSAAAKSGLLLFLPDHPGAPAVPIDCYNSN